MRNMKSLHSKPKLKPKPRPRPRPRSRPRPKPKPKPKTRPGPACDNMATVPLMVATPVGRLSQLPSAQICIPWGVHENPSNAYGIPMDS